jgi:hypothetical protein
LVCPTATVLRRRTIAVLDADSMAERESGAEDAVDVSTVEHVVG